MFLLSAPYVLYGADATYDDTLSISRNTYALMQHLNNQATFEQNITDLDGIDLVDPDDDEFPIVEMAIQAAPNLHEPEPSQAPRAEHIIIAGSLALSAGLITYLLLNNQTPEEKLPTRLVEPFTASAAASAGFKLFEAGSATLVTLLTFGGGYWVLRNFFTSDLKHRFDGLKREFDDIKRQFKENTAEVKKEVTDVKMMIKAIGETNSKVMGNLTQQQRLLKELHTESPSKKLEDIIKKNDENLQNISQMTPEALRHKRHHNNPFKWLGRLFHKKSP